MTGKPRLTTKLRFRRFARDVLTHTPFLKMIILLIVLWLTFSAGMYWAESGAAGTSVTAYFLRPLQRPARQIIDTIEFNLEQLDDLSVEELDLLKDTTDALILHMERHEARSSGRR